MATYRTIATSETAADAPVTVTLMSALADNPLAIAEGDSSAPRISPSATGFTAISGDASGTLTLSDFTGYLGATINVHASNATGVSDDFIELAISDDGASFSGSVQIIPDISADSGGSSTVTIDFTSGDVTAAGHSQGGAASYAETISGVSADVTHIRLSQAGSGTLSISALALVNSGSVA